ncbi:MAG: DEAD/DEAH box helicase [Candidatus Nanoarchaeia archaeon]
MKFQGFTLDKFQEDAVHSIENNRSVLVSAPTGSGKTLIADYIIDRDLKEEKRVIYTAPIKALSNQKYKDFTAQYGEDAIGLITGDLVINPTGQVLIMTQEVYRNMAIINDPMLKDVSYVIMDEIHYISDEERGHIWEESIIFSPKHVRFLFLSATIPNSEEFGAWVKHATQEKLTIVKHHERPVPLDRKFYDVVLGITTLEKIKQRQELDRYPAYGQVFRGRGQRRPRIPPPEYADLLKELKNREKLPCIYFVLSRVKTQEYAHKLSEKQNFLTPEEHKQIAYEIQQEFKKVSTDLNTFKSTKILRQCLTKGVAFHHAGLLPDIKHIVEHLFGKGLVKVLFATETFAVGINYPAKTVCFDSLRKYTGHGFRYFTSKEYFQISGRAGRRGIDKEGLSVALIHRPSADFKKIRSFTTADTMPLKSQFKLSYNTVLNMVHMHNDKEIKEILTKNFYTFQESQGKPQGRVLGTIKARYTKAVKLLLKMGYIKEDHQLTDLGRFTTKIFSHELEVSQLFAANFDWKWDEYFTMLILGAIAYEEKRDTKFYKKHPTKQIRQFTTKMKAHPYLRRFKWHKDLDNLTAIVRPLYEQESFIEIMKNTSMPEGDMIRFFMQLLDKLEQIDKATDDDWLKQLVRNCKRLVKDSLEGIHVF